MSAPPPPPLAPALPARPRLLPGAGVYRRDDQHLQVGLGAPRRVVLEDHPEVRALLRALESPDPRADVPQRDLARGARALTALAAAGLLVDAGRPRRPAWPPRGPAAGSTTPAWRRPSARPPSTPLRRLRVRGEARVQVLAAPGLHAEVVSLLRDCGIGLCATGPGRGRAHEDPTLVLVVGPEPDRELVDELVREQVPHLLVTAQLESYVLGPFVVPGRTACLRCLDAHAGDRDPRRAVVLAQHAHRAGPAPGALAPEPSDPALRHLAVAWAVRDVVRHLDGERPSTWSATIGLGPDLAPDR